MIDRVPFVVFSDDWGRHPSSCQHLFRRIARLHPTLWVNTVGLRPPRFDRTDATRALDKLRGWFEPTPAADPGGTADDLELTVVAPPMIPWMRPAMIRSLNRASVVRRVRAAMARVGIEAPILVITVPNGVEAVGQLGERTVVYYCVDDFTRWPGVDGAMAAQMEEALLARADALIATSESLAVTRCVPGVPVHILPHGVDLQHFARASDPTTRPLEGVRRGRPVMGFLGLIDDRIDRDLVAGLARTRPDWDIVLVGPVDRRSAAWDSLRNVRLFPAVPYARVPEALASFDVAILPYADNELTRAINPLKLREYLASGRPVVATPLPEVARFASHVALARGTDAFVRACDDALRGPRDLRGVRAERLASEGWDARAEEFLSWCEQACRNERPRRARATIEEARS